jgi:hypothetical protein
MIGRRASLGRRVLVLIAAAASAVVTNTCGGKAFGPAGGQSAGGHDGGAIDDRAAPPAGGHDADTVDDRAAPPTDSQPSEATGNHCFLPSANYDHSCSVSTDCVARVQSFPVQFDLNYCKPQLCWCGGDSLNKAAATQYLADLMNTPLGAGAVPPPMCSCPVYSQPCCLSGRCTVGIACFQPGDAGLDEGGPGDAAQEPGLEDGSVLCSFNAGPLDAGVGDAGPSRWCGPRESCKPFNGGWECCTATGPVSFCVPPVGH